MKTIRSRLFNGAGLVMTICTFLVSVASQSNAALINYDSLSAFNSAVGAHTQIGFANLPVGTLVGNQYSSLGVLFTDGDDTTVSRIDSFPTDGIGLAGGPNSVPLTIISLQFGSPMTAVGADFPGALRIEVFSGATPIGTSSNFGQSGTGFFGGVVSDTPFDRVILTDWFDPHVFIDNLHFAPVPEPSTLALIPLGAGLVFTYHRSRKKSA